MRLPVIASDYIAAAAYLLQVFNLESIALESG
jgi:hypothetical protein